MTVLLGIGLIIGGVLLYWWSEYRLPYGPAWRSSLLTGIAGLMMGGGPLLLLINRYTSAVLAWIFPAVLILILGPVFTLDSSRNAPQILTGSDPRKRKRKSKSKRGDDWVFPPDYERYQD